MASSGTFRWLRATLSLPGIPSRLLTAACLLAPGSVIHAQTATAHYSGAQSTVPTSAAIFPSGGIGVDAAGNVYLSSSSGAAILKETLSGGFYTETSFSTSVAAGNNGVAADAAGNVYIAGIPGGVLKETLSAGVYSESTIPFDHLGSNLEFPEGIAVDGSGDVFVADNDGQQVLKATLSGGNYTESTVPTSGLGFPFGIAADAAGNAYVASGERILREAAAGGKNSQSTSVDLGAGQRILGVAVDARDNLYFLDFEGPKTLIQKATLEGTSYSQSTVATSAPENPVAIAADPRGDVYIADAVSNHVQKLQLASVDFGGVAVGSTSPSISLIFTFDTAGKINSPVVVTQGSLFQDFTDAGTGSCTSNGKTHAYHVGDTCTVDVSFKPRFSGERYGAALLLDGFGHILASAYVYGAGLGAQTTFLPGRSVSLANGLAQPLGVAVDGGGNLFVAESGSGVVYKETLSGGTYVQSAIASGLSHPAGLALDGMGNVYVAAADGAYKETLANGAYSQTEIVTDLKDLEGIAVDGSGNVYVTSALYGDVHKAALAANGVYTETAIGSGISVPTGVAVDGSGNIYIADGKSGDVYKETLQPNGSYAQTTVAGGLAGPQGIAVAGGGNLYVTGSTGGEIYREALQADGSYLQTIAAGGLTAPWGIAVDGKGNLYLSQDTLKGDLALIDVADPPSLSFVPTEVGSASLDSPQTVTVSNIGNLALGFPVPASRTNPNVATSFPLDGATTCPVVSVSVTPGSLAAGGSCVYAIDFIPVSRGSISGSLAITDTNLNVTGPGYARQTIALGGTGLTSDATRTTLRVTPNPVAAGLGITITATVADTTTAATVPNGSVAFTDSVAGTVVSLNGGAEVALSNGKAVLNVILSVAGTHTITAHYSGIDDRFSSSTGEGSLIVQP
jgi:sugar lactone lactonase YvrE